jgi:hypothetical protein
MNLTDHVAAEFRANELVLIAESMGLSPISRWGGRKLVDTINAHIARTGIPTAPTDPVIAQLLEEFLFVAEWTDKKGNPLARKSKSEPAKTLQQFLTETKQKKPDCFGFADDKAPECDRCELYNWCADDRVQNLPSCYGLLFKFDEPECKGCLEAPFCKAKGDNSMVDTSTVKPSRKVGK